MTNAVTPDGIQQFVDHAATKSDRWLFVALLVIVMIGGVLAARWLAAQSKQTFDVWREDMKAMQARMESLHQDRVVASEKYADELRKVIAQQATDYRDALREHGTIIVRNAEAMGAVNQGLRELQSSCAIARAGWPPPRMGAVGHVSNQPQA